MLVWVRPTCFSFGSDDQVQRSSAHRPPDFCLCDISGHDRYHCCPRPISRPVPYSLPSTIVKSGNRYWAFSTGQGILYSGLPICFRGNQVQGFSPVLRTGFPKPFPATPATCGLRTSFSTMANSVVLLCFDLGEKPSAIGLAANPTLNPDASNYAWTDKGIVFQSRREDVYNAIDPAIFRDADGRLWLAFGSFWTGIKLIQMDPLTGKRSRPIPRYTLWPGTVQSKRRPCTAAASIITSS